MKSVLPSGDSVDAGLRLFRKANLNRLGPGTHRKRIGRSDEAPGIYTLNLLLREGILTRKKGHEGWVYIPERKHTRRMGEIMAKLKLSRSR
jgi:hypothetical protein